MSGQQRLAVHGQAFEFKPLSFRAGLNHDS